MISRFVFSACLVMASICVGAAEESAEKALHDYLAIRLDSYAQSLAAGTPSMCPDEWRALYDNDTLAVSIFLGFTDAPSENMALDGPFQQALIDHLIKECSGNYFACGFTATPDDSSTLTKTVMVEPGRPKTVVLRVLSSAVSENYTTCITSLADGQRAKSDAVTRAFLDALGRDDVVLYAGHARFGTGPGFRPLSTAALENAAFRPVMSRMRLASSQSAHPKIIGIASCWSEKWYARELHAMFPGTALFLTTDVTAHDVNVLSIQGMLHALLGMQCYARAVESISVKLSPADHRLYGFFLQSPHPRYPRLQNLVSILAALLVMPFLVIRMARRCPIGMSAFPAPSPGDFAPGVAAWMICLVPSVLVARLWIHQRMAVFPLLLTVLGFLLLAIAVQRRRIGLDGVRRIAAGATPFVMAAAVLYFVASFVPEVGVRNAIGSLVETLKFAGMCAALLPFVLFTETILAAPVIENTVARTFGSIAMSLAFYMLLCLGVAFISTDFRPSPSAVLAFALYLRVVSLILHKIQPDGFAEVVFQVLTLGWIFVEGIQGLIYG